MPALNFREQFAEAIEAGEKRQTVRAFRKDGRPHCKPGDVLKLYTGMRTASCRLLGEATVTHVRNIRIMDTGMELDGVPLFPGLIFRDQTDPTDNEFAQADGFHSFMDMATWFGKVHELPFEGVVIQWDEIR